MSTQWADKVGTFDECQSQGQELILTLRAQDNHNWQLNRVLMLIRTLLLLSPSLGKKYTLSQTLPPTPIFLYIRLRCDDVSKLPRVYNLCLTFVMYWYADVNFLYNKDNHGL